MVHPHNLRHPYYEPLFRFMICLFSLPMQQKNAHIYYKNPHESLMSGMCNSGWATRLAQWHWQHLIANQGWFTRESFHAILRANWLPCNLNFFMCASAMLVHTYCICAVSGVCLVWVCAPACNYTMLSCYSSDQHEAESWGRWQYSEDAATLTDHWHSGWCEG